MDTFLLLDKPVGMSSAFAAAQARKALGFSKSVKTGHTGTLDPFATGLLSLAFGCATKLIPYLPSARKVYRATLRLGIQTDTLDSEGCVVAQAPVPHFSRAHLEAILLRFVGAQEQTPPMYSAIKQDGKRLYAYARANPGCEVERKPRRIEIESLTLLQFAKDEIDFEVVCSRGTYVRVLGEEIAHALGTVGHLIALKRLESDGFSIENAASLTDLSPLRAQNERGFVGMIDALRHFPTVPVPSHEALVSLRHGRTRVISRSNQPRSAHYVATWEARAVAVMSEDGESDYLKIDRIL